MKPKTHRINKRKKTVAQLKWMKAKFMVEMNILLDIPEKDRTEAQHDRLGELDDKLSLIITRLSILGIESFGEAL